MNKVIIIGCPGSGKSTFARKLRDKTNLPLFYLDMIYHHKDKTTLTDKEFDRELNELLSKDQWIIDGNYSRTLETRMKECDRVYLFDISIEECINGVENRIGTKREDMPWIEEEFDSEFKQFILDFPIKQMPYIYDLIEKYKNTINIVIFKTRKEADEYLDNM